MYASANIEFGFQSAFKGTGGSGWFKVRFRVSRLSPVPPLFFFSPSPFFSLLLAPPFLRATRCFSKGSCLRQTRIYATDFRIRLGGRAGNNVDPSNGETLPVYRSNYAVGSAWHEDTRSVFTRCLLRAHEREEAYRSYASLLENRETHCAVI